MKTTILTIAALTFVQTAEAVESFTGYDSIVRELSTSTAQLSSTPRIDEDFVRIHFGMGMVTSQLSLDLPSDLPDSQTLQGIEAKIGIDLFDPHWIAEGAIRAFNPESFGDGEISLREFDLLVKYRNAINHPIYFSIGAGMAARYLQFSDSVADIGNRRPSTPASILAAGFEAEIGPKFSAGIGISYRSRMISDTPDAQAVDGSIQLLGHF